MTKDKFIAIMEAYFPLADSYVHPDSKMQIISIILDNGEEIYIEIK